MNVQGLSLTRSSAVFMDTWKNNSLFSSKKTVHYNHYIDDKKENHLSINHVITGTVVGGIIGALFSGNTKSFMTIMLSSLRGAGIALLGMVAFGCVKSFIHSDFHK